MKIFLMILALFLLSGCKENKTNLNNALQDFPHFDTVELMMQSMHDYEGTNFEILSEKPVHIRVSSDFIKGDLNEIMIEQNKRNIVYVAFETFALTSLEEITITSIPVIRQNFNPTLPYDGKLINELKLQRTVTRLNASKIIEKYTKSQSFKDLYDKEGTLYLPNAKFDLLKFEKLENVFNEL